MDYTSRLKLPRYAGTDAADLTKGYNVAADRLEAVIGQGLMTYPVTDGKRGALPVGAKTPCLILVPATGELWYEDGATPNGDTSSDEQGVPDGPQEGAGPTVGGPQGGGGADES